MTPSRLFRFEGEVGMSLSTALAWLLGVRVRRPLEPKISRYTRTLIIALLTISVADAFAAEKKPLTGEELSALLGNGLAISAADMHGGSIFEGRLLTPQTAPCPAP